MRTFKLFLLTICFSFFAFNTLNAQTNLLNADNPEDIGKKDFSQKRQDVDEKIEYSYIDEKDILFSKVIWELIDLDQKVNFPYLYPIDTSVVGKERRPLIHYLIKGLESGKIKRAYADGKFNHNLTWEEIYEGTNTNNPYGGLKFKRLNQRKTTQLWRKNGGSPESYLMLNKISLGEEYGSDLNRVTDSLKFIQSQEDNPKPYARYTAKRDSILMEILPEDYVQKYDFTYDMIESYKIKGVWYFDKKISELKYRPIAIAPVAKQVTAKPGNLEKRNAIQLALQFDPNADISSLPQESKPLEMFWIYFKDARDVLKNSYVFSAANSSVRKSFDELINARYFHTMIYLEENMYEDRLIEEYVPENAFMRLLESERIKEKIRNFEHDMWSW